MAGQSQAANFGGMLSQIGQSIGGMGSAGDGLLQPLRNTFAPTVDPEDPNSLLRAAQYQTAVGHTDQAKAYTLQATQLQEQQTAAAALAAEKQDARFSAAYNTAVGQVRAAAQAGNKPEFEQALSQLRALRRQATTKGQMGVVMQSQDMLKDVDKTLASGVTRNAVVTASKIDDTLANNKQLPEQARMALEERKADLLLGDPEATKVYNDNLKAKLDAEVRQQTLQRTQKENAATDVINAVYLKDGYQAAVKMAEKFGESGKAVVASLKSINDASQEIMTQEKTSENFAGAAERVSTMIDNLEVDDTTKDMYRKQLATYSKQAESVGLVQSAYTDLNGLMKTIASQSATLDKEKRIEQFRIDSELAADERRANNRMPSVGELDAVIGLSKDATGWMGESPLTDIEAADVARDVMRHKTGKPTIYAYDERGNPKFDSEGYPIRASEDVHDKETSGRRQGYRRSTPSPTADAQTTGEWSIGETK